MDGKTEINETELNNGVHKNNTGNYDNNNDVINERKTEKLKIIDKQYLIQAEEERVPGESEAKNPKLWRTCAVIVSWLSIIATLAIGITEFVVAQAEGSSAAFGLAFSSVLDVLTSTVVLWRYYKAHDTFSKRREHISCVVLGVLFVVSSAGIAGKAIAGLLERETPDMSDHGVSILVTTSILATCVCFILFISKVVIAKQLLSWTILTDALNSLVGAVIALSMVITSEVTKSNRFLWYLDSTVGLVVSLFLLMYGLWLLTKHVPEVRRSRNYHETK
ncbi:unnamed protein product [Clavelina lepadiformis]|uniref:Cation efflux protein transmembrane domain-containing protein n=1 Tax=Clavelina lepadiformis TaxID=159417 RepID=A0ABP0F057_CLALP